MRIASHRGAGGINLHIFCMKKFVVILSLVLIAMPASLKAQDFKQQIKERKEIQKQSKKDLNEKATKAARKEAKELQKNGWVVAPGALPLDKQLDRSYMMQMEYDDYGYPKFIMGEAMSVGENYDAAKVQAQELAKLNLAGQIQSEVTALVENAVANKQLGADEAVSVTKTIEASKSLISQKLGRVIVVTEVYRTLKNKNKEVLLRVAYNAAMARAAAKQVLRDNLEDESKELQDKLDEIFSI